MTSQETLIENILSLEWEMFQNVKARYPVSCQQKPDEFRLYRGEQFSMWSEDALKSYLDDLLRAKAQGKNLMTLKYARMEGIISVLNDNPCISEIMEMELAAQREAAALYPHLIGQGRPLEEDNATETSFKTYLRGELETYSDRTLELLLGDYRQTRQRGENWSLKFYAHLVARYGYASLDQAEEALWKKERHS